MKPILIYLLLSTFIYANSYALIIGTNKNGLQGAVNDANEIKKVLTFQGVKNIKILRDGQATKRNILNNLKSIASKLNPNDRFYFFFSGHGTSLFDPNFAQLIDNDKRLITLLENSGGLIPWDFDKRRAYQTIISAKRDLAPIFKDIDVNKKAFTMVMIDACFSGMSYKDVSYNPRKQIPIKAKPHFGDSYPYKNVVYLASTAISDWATEDKSRRPYRGYFSRALEHCLYQTNRLRALESCINSVPMAQSTVVYPKYRDVSTLFSRHRVKYAKDIVVVPKKVKLVDELFGLVKPSDRFTIFATQQNGIERKVYTPTTPLNLQVRTKEKGYLVFLSFGEDERLKLHYPKYTPRKITPNQTESLGEFEAEKPFGEEYLVGFLVDKATSEKFVEIYKQKQGNLGGEASIREVIELLRGKSGSSLMLRSTE